MEADKKNVVTIKTNVIKQKPKPAPAPEKPFVPVQIERVFPDGRRHLRICDRADLASFGRLGYKLVGKLADEKPADDKQADA